MSGDALPSRKLKKSNVRKRFSVGEKKPNKSGSRKSSPASSPAAPSASPRKRAADKEEEEQEEEQAEAETAAPDEGTPPKKKMKNSSPKRASA